jgi:hypothetical protein
MQLVMRFPQAKIFHSKGLWVKILKTNEIGPDLAPGVLLFSRFYFTGLGETAMPLLADLFFGVEVLYFVELTGRCVPEEDILGLDKIQR